MYEYDDYISDTCFFGFDFSNKGQTFEVLNEFKTIAGFKCQKAIHYSPKSSHVSYLIVWFTNDITLKDFINKRMFNVNGVVLESENDLCIHTTTEVTIISNEPEILKIMRSIKPCNLDLPYGMY